jgi:hypothetical protein
MNIVDYIVKNWDTLPKSKFDDDHIVTHMRVLVLTRMVTSLGVTLLVVAVVVDPRLIPRRT